MATLCGLPVIRNEAQFAAASPSTGRRCPRDRGTRHRGGKAERAAGRADQPGITMARVRVRHAVRGLLADRAGTERGVGRVYGDAGRASDRGAAAARSDRRERGGSRAGARRDSSATPGVDDANALRIGDGAAHDGQGARDHGRDHRARARVRPRRKARRCAASGSAVSSRVLPSIADRCPRRRERLELIRLCGAPHRRINSSVSAL